MPVLAELVDAVVGVDTHRDTHEVEIALPTGTPIGKRKISDDSSGFVELLAWIGELAPGPRVILSIEGAPQLRCWAGPRSRCVPEVLNAAARSHLQPRSNPAACNWR